MAITVKHSKVSTIPDDADTSLVRPSDWNADHTLVGTIDVANGGTGATTASDARTNLGLGTIATQNANAVAVTGGTINNATIGATTPSTGNFTTITGQTEVLKGTGQNLFLQSNTFTNASWTLTASTVGTTVTTTDPFGGSSAYKLVEDNTTNGHFIYQAPASVVGLTYTVSIYLKSAERGYALLATTSGTPTTSIQINLSTGAVTTGTGTPLNAFSTSLGNGWYRVGFSIAATTTAGVQTNTYISTDGVWGNRTYLGTTGSGIYVYGAQVEIGSTVGTFIPTTTTAVYGTPSLSFSGVAGLGLESNGALYVSPAGTGALQAQATTSSTVGGNARGANAVDWQTSRSAASQVAQGQYSVISGGIGNTAASFNSTVVAGSGNLAQGNYSFVGGGQNNAATGAFLQTYSVIGGGYSNQANGIHNVIVGGAVNSGTSITAVTTQSATMNGTTAVTLAASNANIKVGQYIAGTSISDRTYVSAVSGTSLTLSQAASGSSTSTLSFYTPHGVVVGGGNNQATGSYSFIGGGGDAGTASLRNVASGDWSFVGGGFRNTASGIGSFIGGGGNFGVQSASGQGAFIGAGWGNAVVGAAASALGASNQASGDYSAVIGGSYGLARSITGNTVFNASNAPFGTAFGCQGALLVLARQTTDATATVLASTAAAASGTNQVILPNNSAYYFTGSVIAGVTGGGNTKGWTIEGVIKRGANAASTAIVGTATVTSLYADAGAATWTVTALADTTNGGLKITVTGQAATTIRWVAKVETTEMTF